MPLSSSDLAAIWLTLQLASITTVLLLLLGTPLAWWLARTRSWLKAPIGAVVALPLVLPPTVIGFYLLVAMGPQGPATLRAGPFDRFFHVALPLARPGLVTASVLGFAHTIGEFGVVLMIGGNIPDQTRVVSVQIFNHVEAMEYAQAHWLPAGMLVFSFAILLTLQRRGRVGARAIS